MGNDSSKLSEETAQLHQESWWNFDSDVSADEDWIKSPDDQRDERSTESSDSGVSLKREGSKGGVIHSKDRVSPRLDSSSSEEDNVSDDEDWVKSPDDLMESSDSGVSLKSDQSKDELIDFKDRDSPRLADFSSSEEEHDVSDDEDLVKSPDDQGRETNQEVG